MNKFVSTQSVAMMLGLSFIAVSACDQRGPISPSAGPGIGSTSVKPGDNGNGAPSGAHFNLNLLGMTRDKTASIAGGNRIFIYYEGRTKIMLREGDYAVIDGNGTDGTAEFQLPNPEA
jgi:hypothetical protein